MSALPTQPTRSGMTRSPLVILGMGLVLLAGCFLASLALGAARISLGEVYAAFAAFDNSTEHLIVRTVRLPRSLVALLVGAALSVAGAVMQGIARNPLASPVILGINAGAALVVVAAAAIAGTALDTYAWLAFAGAGVTAATVYALAALGRGGVTPLNLTLAGAAIAAFTSSITTGILVVNQRTLDEIRFWLAGSVAGRSSDVLWSLLPGFALGLGVAIALGRQITALNLGEDVAKGLGLAIGRVKLAAAISVVLLAGSSVAIAGPIGFVGLIVPHVVRFAIGVDYRWILPLAAVFGASFLLAADVFARLVFQPYEPPVGLVMPLLGAPFFIYLVRKKLS